ECNSEYLRLTRVSQNESFNDDDGHSITDPITLDLDDSIVQNSMHPRTGSLHSLLSIEPRKRNLTSIASPEKTSDEGLSIFSIYTKFLNYFECCLYSIVIHYPLFEII
ncbi:unnamed protein product, partial [Rotaria magnacalcarata]